MAEWSIASVLKTDIRKRIRGSNPFPSAFHFNIMVRVKIFTSGGDTPKYATLGSSGVDLCSAVDTVIPALSRVVIPTGIYVEMPVGIEAQVRSRSGLAAKYGVVVLNSPGTVDSDYRGEIRVILYNTSSEDFVITCGMRIAQLVFARYEQVDLIQVQTLNELSDTNRGANGFGHSGI